jgi:hypothetical protein
MAQNSNPSHLDPGQIVKRAFDGSNDRLRVDIGSSISVESSDRIRVDANITAPEGTSVLIDATTDSIKIGNSAVGPFLNVNSDGSINTNTTIEDVTGTFTPSGLKTAGKITTVQITDTATALPSTPLTARNAIAISNLSTSQTLYIGFSNSVTADRSIGTNAGWEIGPLEGFNLDITDSVVIYGITASGMSALIKILELS